MASRNYDIDLALPLHDQTDPSTWIGHINDAYEDSFIKYACGICALASFKDISIAEAKARGAFTGTNAGVANWLGTTEQKPANKLERIVHRIVNEGLPTIVRVGPKGDYPAHFVTVSGFFGTLPTSSIGNAICTAATADMVLINDPYGGNCSTLADLSLYYGSIQYLRY